MSLPRSAKGRSARSQPAAAGSSSFRDISGRARFITGLDRAYALLVTVADEIGGLQPTCGAGLANGAEAYSQPPRVRGMHVLRCPTCWRLGGCTELGAGRSKVHFGDLDDRLKLCGMTSRVSSGGRLRWPSSRSPKCTFARRRPRTLHPPGVSRSSSWGAQRDRQGPLVQFAIQRAVRHFLCKSRTKHVNLFRTATPQRTIVVASALLWKVDKPGLSGRATPLKLGAPASSKLARSGDM